ncbi:hypothetical protein GGI35DRAFT_14031 [Trichoderma velutinum]
MSLRETPQGAERGKSNDASDYLKIVRDLTYSFLHVMQDLLAPPIDKSPPNLEPISAKPGMARKVIDTHCRISILHLSARNDHKRSSSVSHSYRYVYRAGISRRSLGSNRGLEKHTLNSLSSSFGNYLAQSSSSDRHDLSNQAFLSTLQICRRQFVCVGRCFVQVRRHAPYFNRVFLCKRILARETWWCPNAIYTIVAGSASQSGIEKHGYRGHPVYQSLQNASLLFFIGRFANQ